MTNPSPTPEAFLRAERRGVWVFVAMTILAGAAVVLAVMQ
jgi:hypothetical protein